MSILTSVKDLDLLIMEKMDDRTLLSFCQSNQGTNKLCQNEQFWKKRFFNKFTRDSQDLYTNFEEYKNSDRTWRNAYLSMLKYMVDPGDDELNTFARALMHLARDNEGLNEDKIQDLGDYFEDNSAIFIGKKMREILREMATLRRIYEGLRPYTDEEVEKFMINHKKEIDNSAQRMNDNYTYERLISPEEYMYHHYLSDVYDIFLPED